jgi:hypothetical protein
MEDALAQYQQVRDEHLLPVYEFTYGLERWREFGWREVVFAVEPCSSPARLCK